MSAADSGADVGATVLQQGLSAGAAQAQPDPPVREGADHPGDAAVIEVAAGILLGLGVFVVLVFVVAALAPGHWLLGKRP